jgi:hypothetical protein
MVSAVSDSQRINFTYPHYNARLDAALVAKLCIHLTSTAGEEAPKIKVPHTHIHPTNQSGDLLPPPRPRERLS